MNDTFEERMEMIELLAELDFQEEQIPGQMTIYDMLTDDRTED